jgi:hypothetical protein
MSILFAEINAEQHHGFDIDERVALVRCAFTDSVTMLTNIIIIIMTACFHTCLL